MFWKFKTYCKWFFTKEFWGPCYWKLTPKPIKKLIILTVFLELLDKNRVSLNDTLWANNLIKDSVYKTLEEAVPNYRGAKFNGLE